MLKLGFMLLTLGIVGRLIAADEVSRLLSDIESWGKLGEHAPPKLTESVDERIEKHATNVTAFLVTKLAEIGASEESLRVYVGILGLTKDTNAVPVLTNFFFQTKSEPLKEGCFASLAFIGGEPAIKFLLATLNNETNKERRFTLLNCLAETQHESVLPKTVEVLECDPHMQYWKSVFVFGKMGDRGVPFLVEKLNDTNRNVRANAIGLLGQWLVAPEAIRPLRERFWKEEDTEIRGLIQCSITGTSSEKAFTEFLNEVVAKGKDKDTVEGAKAALKSFSKDKAKIVALKKKRKPSGSAFQKEYSLLYKSAGHKGDFEALGKASTLADEPALKKLRERILQRNSDEAFEDYRKVCSIIWLNRFPADIE